MLLSQTVTVKGIDIARIWYNAFLIPVQQRIKFILTFKHILILSCIVVVWSNPTRS